MKGLEVSEIRLSQLENEGTIGAEYYAPEFLKPYQRLLDSSLATERLEDVCSRITDGDHGSADYADSGVPFILSEAVDAGWIEDAACRFITPTYAASLKRSELKEGDVLVTKTGVYFGKSAVVPSSWKGANTIAHVGILRPKAGWDSYYLSTFFNSRYGYIQLRRRGIKATRPEIKLLEFDDIRVPRASERFQSALRKFVLSALDVRNDAFAALAAAEQALLRALGLENWQPPEPLTYTRSATDVLAAGRFDSKFFSPRVDDLLRHLRAGERSVRDVAPARTEKFTPGGPGHFNYIEIGAVLGDGTVASERVPKAEAPSRATWLVRPGDIVTSTVRPARRLSALITPEQDGYVASSGFVVLQPREIPAEVLLTYLRLPPVCELMDLHTSASLYPAISDRDLLNLPCPKFSANTCESVIAAVRSAHAARREALALLAQARRAVEIAIEESESAALAFLRE